MPAFLWRRQRFLKALESLGGLLMGSGRMSLTSKLPNGQIFISYPRYTWNIAASQASERGQNLGAEAPPFPK